MANDKPKDIAKQKKFLREYFKHFSVTKAAESVGYKGVAVCVSGSRLLKKAKESGLYAEEREAALERSGVSLDAVLSGIGNLAHSNMADYIKIDEDGQADINLAGLSRDQLACIQEVSVDTTGGSGDGERRRVLRTRFKLADKGVNLERLLKHFGGISDRVEHTGEGGGPIRTAIEVTFVTPDATS